jgi:fatty-acyl-CoA synthase
MSEVLVSILRRRASETPRAPMAFFADTSLTYGSGYHAALRWTTAYRARGGQPGDPVLIAMPNQSDFAAAFFGAHLASMPAVPLPPRRRETASEFACRIEDRARIVSARLLALAEPPEPPVPKDITILWPALLAVDPVRPGRSPASGDYGLIQFTSGTSGTAKAVPLSQGGVSYQAARLNEGLGVDAASDHALSWLPLYHDMGLFGFLLAPLFSGTPSTIIKTETFARYPNQWLDSITRVRATITAAPPSAYAVAARFARQARDFRVDLSSLRVALMGAEFIDPLVLDKIADGLSGVGLSRSAILPAYGLAEVGAAVSLAPVGRNPRYLVYREEGGTEQTAVSCGRPIPGTSVRIVNGANTLGEGPIGSIALTSPSLLRHYLDVSGPLPPRQVDGWFVTGDRGFIRDGELHVLGREDDLIIVGGSKFMPEEIETVAHTYGGRLVRAAVAVGYRSANAATQKVALMLHTPLKDQRRRDQLTLRIRHELVRLGLPIDRIDFMLDPRLLQTENGKCSRASYRAFLAATSA